MFLNQKQIDKLKDYFLEQYRNRYVAYVQERFERVKEFQSFLKKQRKDIEEQALSGNVGNVDLKALKSRMEKVDQEYEGMKQDFEKLRAVIGDLADVLDEEFKNYVVEEDKTLQFK